jgi:hypothetical protein
MESVYICQPPLQLFHWDTFVLANTFLDPVQFAHSGEFVH